MPVESTVLSLKQLFSDDEMDYILSLPEYQREYTWPKKKESEKDQVRVLAKSILRDMKRKGITSFLGMIVIEDHFGGKSRKQLKSMGVTAANTFMRNALKKIANPRSTAKEQLSKYYDDHRPHVIDGQQRITTLLLACAVCRKLLHDESLFPGAIDSTKFGRRTRDSWSDLLLQISCSENKFRFEIAEDEDGEGDFPQATKFCMDPTGWPTNNRWPKVRHGGFWPIKSATENLWKIWKKWLEDIDDVTGKNGRKAQFGRLLNHLINDLKLVVVTVDNTLQAHLIFNSLNTLGEQLTIGEKITSYIRLKATEFPQTTRKKVDKAIVKIRRELRADNRSERDPLSDFFYRHHLSKFKRVEEKYIFDAYESRLSDMIHADFKDFLTEISTSVGHYLAVTKAEIPNHKHDLADLKSAGTVQHISLLMAAQAVGLTDDEMDDLFKILRIWVARYEIAGRGTARGRVLFGEFNKWSLLLHEHKADAIRTNTPSIANDVKELITEIGCHDNASMLDCLKEARISQGYAKFLLRQDYQTAFPGDYDTWKWNAEHIAPHDHKNWPNAGWQTVDGRTLTDRRKEDYKYRLGNYIIIREKLNKSCRNRGWRNKSVGVRGGGRRQIDGKWKLYKEACKETDVGKKETQQFVDFVNEFDKPVRDRKDWANTPWTPVQIDLRTEELVGPLPTLFPMSVLE